MEKRSKLGAALLAAVVCAALTLSTVGCSSQQDAAEVVATLGTAVASLETLENNTLQAAQIEQDTQTAEQEILSWKSGSSTQDIAEALGIVESDLNLLPVSAVDQALVDLALGTVQQLLAIFPGSAAAAAPATAIAAATPAITTYTPGAVRNVPLATPIKNAKDFKTRWNNLLPQPLAGAALK